MTPEAQQIAIAEACGWSAIQKESGLWLATKNGVVNSALELEDRNRVILASCPDYINDLNAMRDLEKRLCDAQLIEYDKNLKNVLSCGCRVCDWNAYPGDFIWHATAAQRAEAFLRTIGKWVE